MNSPAFAIKGTGNISYKTEELLPITCAMIKDTEIKIRNKNNAT